MTGTNTSSMTVARTELLVAQVVWATARLAPGTGDFGRKAVREAIARGVFQSMTFYGCGSDGRHYAILRVWLDADRHREQLRVHPQVQPGKHWKGQLAPDLRQMVECFDGVVARFGLAVSARMRIRKGAELVVDGRPIPLHPPLPPPSLAEWEICPDVAVSRLEELHLEYAVANDLATRDIPSPSGRDPPPASRFTGSA